VLPLRDAEPIIVTPLLDAWGLGKSQKDLNRPGFGPGWAGVTQNTGLGRPTAGCTWRRNLAEGQTEARGESLET